MSKWKGSYPKLIEQFSYLTISPRDLLALEGKGSLSRRETAKTKNEQCGEADVAAPLE